MEKTANRIKGQRSKAAGDNFESLISNACAVYKLNSKASIEKTPEPMRVVRKLSNKHFACFFEKKAQPDFKGTLWGGKSIVFEAKHTSKDRLLCSVIKPQQRTSLNLHQELGAECFVLIGFSFENFYFVPWHVFKNAKEILGRKYLMPEDLGDYEVKMQNGYLDFLKNVVTEM